MGAKKGFGVTSRRSPCAHLHHDRASGVETACTGVAPQAPVKLAGHRPIRAARSLQTDYCCITVSLFDTDVTPATPFAAAPAASIWPSSGTVPVKVTAPPR